MGCLKSRSLKRMKQKQKMFFDFIDLKFFLNKIKTSALCEHGTKYFGFRYFVR